MQLLVSGRVLLAASVALLDAAPVWLAGLPPGVPTRVLPTPDGLLLASDAGLYRLGDAGWTLLLTRGGVRDLARAAGATVIASAAGLYLWPDGADAPRPLGLGPGAQVESVAVDESGRIWVATGVGLYSRAPGRRTFARDTSLPAGAVAAVRAVGDSVWVAMRGVLWLREHDGSFQPRLRGLGAGWWELRAAVESDGEAILLVPRGLWRIGSRGEQAFELGMGELRGIATLAGVGWIAAEKGLFPLPLVRLGQGAPASTISGEGFDVALGDERLLVAAERGVAAIPLEHAPVVGLADEAAEPPLVLDLALLHRAVLRHQGLAAARMDEVERRARGAALLPEVRVSLAFERDRDRDRDFDQTYTSGALRELRDHSSARDDSVELSLSLIWELQKHRDPARLIAVSRERRELVELRDQVLERVNRLYFERVRVLTRLGAAQPPDDRGELEIRARELAAQLDAWTGGLFSRLDPHSPLESRGLP